MNPFSISYNKIDFQGSLGFTPKDSARLDDYLKAIKSEHKWGKLSLVGGGASFAAACVSLVALFIWIGIAPNAMVSTGHIMLGYSAIGSLGVFGAVNMPWDFAYRNVHEKVRGISPDWAYSNAHCSKPITSPGNNAISGRIIQLSPNPTKTTEYFEMQEMGNAQTN
ncbi:MAG: hypothetical protein K1000chlam4_00622 [Chlamydiae bacterium]|nr:hypothetical protein [Chlamydiota bacterium]